MSDQPISTRPLSDDEKLLRTKFYENLAAQSDLLDKLNERMLTLELAIPGLYATVLKLVSGEKATVMRNTALYAAFACWLAALLLTLIALIPQKWTVDATLLKQDPTKMAQEGLGLEDFFVQSAEYKRRLLVISSVLFFAGVFGAAYTIG